MRVVRWWVSALVAVLGCSSTERLEQAEPTATVIAPVISPETPLAPSIVGPAPGLQNAADVAFDGTNHLVVWTDSRSGTEDIWGARVSSSGVVLDSPGIPISSLLGNQYAAAVAFGAGLYLVVWKAEAVTGNISGARVTPAGQVLDPSPLTILASPGTFGPDIAFDGTNFVVVSGMHTIHAARVTPAGVVLDSPPVVMSVAQKQSAPRIACGPANCLVTWTNVTGAVGSPESEVWGGRLANGVTLDGLGHLIGNASEAQDANAAVAFNGTNYLATWLADGSLKAARVSQAGQVLDTGTKVISPAGLTMSGISVSSIGSDFLLVWSEDTDDLESDLRAATLTDKGVLQPPFWVSTASLHQGVSAAGAGNGQFLVVWGDYRFGIGNSEVFGSRISFPATVADPAGILITTGPSPQTEPAVASDGKGYLTAWVEPSSYALWAATSDIDGKLLSTTPTLISGPYDGTRKGLTASWNGVEYVVTWTQTSSSTSVGSSLEGARLSAQGALLGMLQQVQGIGSGPSHHASSNQLSVEAWEQVDGAIAARRLGPGGTVLDAQPLIIAGADATQHEPGVLSDGQDFLVVFARNDPGGVTGKDIVARRVSSGGQLLDASPIVVSSAALDQTSPRGAFNGTDYLIAWEDSRAGAGTRDIHAARVTRSGTVIDTNGFVVSDAEGGQARPRVVAMGDGDSSLVVWSDPRQDPAGDVFGAWIRNDGQVLDPLGVAIAATPSTAENLAAVASAGSGRALVAYSKYHSAAGAFAIRGNIVSSGAPGGSSCSSNDDCATRFCVDSVCCSVACDAPCSTCSATPGACTQVFSQEDPGTCSGSNVCDATGQCRKKLAQSCALGSECVTGFCADGLCCDSACGGGCDNCSATPGSCALSQPGSPGALPSCAPYLCDGKQPACPAACASDPDCATGHFCDASGQCSPQKTMGQACNPATDCLVAGNCAECSTGFCADGYCCESGCEGGCNRCDDVKGKCQAVLKGQPGSQPACSPYLCDGASASCPTACATSDECAQGFWCDGNECKARAQKGESCALGAQCLTEVCSDGVCCDTVCDGQCESCTTASDLGTCVAVTGKAAHGKCEQGPTGEPCKAPSCDGKDREKCSGLTPKGEGCGTASCNDGFATLAGTCNGEGGCVVPPPVKCEPYVCSGSQCGKAACQSDADCATLFSCLMVPEKGVKECLPRNSTCRDDQTLVTADGLTTTDCAPYRCRDGMCLSSCESTAACAKGMACNASKQCEPVPSGAGSEESGCSCATPGSRAAGGWAWAAALTMCVAALRRRRLVPCPPHLRVRKLHASGTNVAPCYTDRLL